MTISLLAKTSGGQWVADFSSGVRTIPQGTSGDITINCPTGKRIRLTLFYQPGGDDSTNINIIFGSRKIIDNGTLPRASTLMNIDGYFRIGSSSATETGNSTTPLIQGNADESLLFRINTATNSNIFYNYETGD